MRMDHAPSVTAQPLKKALQTDAQSTKRPELFFRLCSRVSSFFSMRNSGTTSQHQDPPSHKVLRKAIPDPRNDHAAHHGECSRTGNNPMQLVVYDPHSQNSPEEGPASEEKRQQLSSDCSEIPGDVAAAEKELRMNAKEISGLQNENHSKSQQLRIADTKLMSAERQLCEKNEEIYKLGMDITRREDDIANLNTRYEQRLAFARNLAEVRQSQKDRAHVAEMDAEIKRGRDAEESHRRTLAQAADENRKKVEELNERYEKIYQQWTADLSEAQEQLASEQQRFRRELHIQRETLAKKHGLETRQLKRDYEELKLEVLKRKQFKGLRDRDLQMRLETLVDQVNDVSNIDWSAQLMKTWPFTDLQLLRMGSNTRLLKKQIIQNSLWCNLYKFVFQTPFRILGREGEHLDSNWKEIYSSDLADTQWRQVSAAIEEQRCDTARALRADMDSSKEISSQSTTLKTSDRGYNVSLENALHVIRTTLGRVADIQPEEERCLESLLHLCAKTWMEFCSQPYRTMITLPTPGIDILSVAPKSSKQVVLVLRPGMKRYGNSHGDQTGKGDLLFESLVQAYAI